MSSYIIVITMAAVTAYTIADFNRISFDGFEYQLVHLNIFVRHNFQKRERGEMCILRIEDAINLRK